VCVRSRQRRLGVRVRDNTGVGVARSGFQPDPLGKRLTDSESFAPLSNAASSLFLWSSVQLLVIRRRDYFFSPLFPSRP